MSWTERFLTYPSAQTREDGGRRGTAGVVCGEQGML